jgi:hypothetical protein
MIFPISYKNGRQKTISCLPGSRRFLYISKERMHIVMDSVSAFEKEHNPNSISLKWPSVNSYMDCLSYFTKLLYISRSLNSRHKQ